MRRQCSPPWRRIVTITGVFACFVLGTVWLWRVRDPFRELPAYGDTLEVVWGFIWYHRVLLDGDGSKLLFYPLIFHPNGWHTATLAHSPSFFVLGMPYELIGGPAFAYNSMALLSLVVCYLGSWRLLRSYVDPLPALVGSLVFTFSGIRAPRIFGGHLHLAWLTSLLPWLAWALRKSFLKGRSRRSFILLSGIIWGLMIDFLLYGIFIGGLVFLLLGPDLFKRRVLRGVLLAAGIALALGSLSIIPYVIGQSADGSMSFGVGHILHWGASVNSLVIPSVFHPIEFVRSAGQRAYLGPQDESGVGNLGLVTFVLGLVGVGCMLRRDDERVNGLVLLTCVAMALALGMLLKWDGETVRCPAFSALNNLLWQLGHEVKPTLFDTEVAPDEFRDGIPLPGYFLTALVPYWESARTVSRYAIVAYLGLVVLACYGMARTRGLPLGLVMTALWMLESLPPCSGVVPLPSAGHPAFSWLADQQLSPVAGVVDLVYPTLSIGGEVVYSTLLHGKPTASGVGSFWPSHTYALWDRFLGDSTALGKSETSAMLASYGVRYVLLHVRGESEHEMWDLVISNPELDPVGCFASHPGPSPWPYDICVAEVLCMRTDKTPIILDDGWYEQESWGVWSGATESSMRWIGTSLSEQWLTFTAFPNCIPNQLQSIVIEVNNEVITQYHWSGCESWSASLKVRPDLLKYGWNQAEFRFGYTALPTDRETGRAVDSRALSVGFVDLDVRDNPGR